MLRRIFNDLLLYLVDCGFIYGLGFGAYCC